MRRGLVPLFLIGQIGVEMKFLSRLFGLGNRAQSSARTSKVRTTARNPFCIEAPSIGFLNLRGAAGNQMAKEDEQVLSPLFSEVHVSDSAVPSVNVLLLYCDVTAAGQIAGRSEGLRDLIAAAGAHIAIVASENPAEHYIGSLGSRNSWSANIVLTLDRKGDQFSAFFAKLFREMYAGKSMLMAWIELAPQIPGHDDSDAPATLMTAEAGHLAFRQRR